MIFNWKQSQIEDYTPTHLFSNNPINCFLFSVALMVCLPINSFYCFLNASDYWTDDLFMVTHGWLHHSSMFMVTHGGLHHDSMVIITPGCLVFTLASASFSYYFFLLLACASYFSTVEDCLPLTQLTLFFFSFLFSMLASSHWPLFTFQDQGYPCVIMRY